MEVRPMHRIFPGFILGLNLPLSKFKTNDLIHLMSLIERFYPLYFIFLGMSSQLDSALCLYHSSIGYHEFVGCMSDSPKCHFNHMAEYA